MMHAADITSNLFIYFSLMRVHINKITGYCWINVFVNMYVCFYGDVTLFYLRIEIIFKNFWNQFDIDVTCKSIVNIKSVRCFQLLK